MPALSFLGNSAAADTVCCSNACCFLNQFTAEEMVGNFVHLEQFR